MKPFTGVAPGMLRWGAFCERMLPLGLKNLFLILLSVVGLGGPGLIDVVLRESEQRCGDQRSST